MKLHLLIPLTIAIGSSSAFAGSDDLKAEAPLTRPAGAPDSNAKGEVKIEHDLDKDRHKLWVEAENIDTSLSFEAWIADAGGTMQFVGVMPIDDPGEVEIEFDSDDGPPLPFGASTVESLSGRAVEVRSGGQIYLTGTIPSFNGSGGGGGGGSGSGGGDWIKVKQSLVRPANSPDSDVTGYVEVRYRTKDNDQKFKVEAEHIDTNVSFSVFLETAVGSGVMQNVGSMKIDDSNEVELEIETEDGDALPFGVAHVSELAGRSVEVRDAGNAIYLAGVIPDIDGSNKNAQAKTSLSGAGKADLKIQKKAKKGDHRFELKLSKVEKQTDFEIWLFDPSQGAMVKVTDVKTKKNGTGKYKVRTKKGQALPLGAATIDQISGLQIELRLTDGSVRFSGAVPSL